MTGAVFMSAFTTKTAVYVLLRGFSGFEVLAIGGTIMAVYGVCYATIENNARRILSYDIVSQVGYMVAGIGIASPADLERRLRPCLRAHHLQGPPVHDHGRSSLRHGHRQTLGARRSGPPVAVLRAGT